MQRKRHRGLDQRMLYGWARLYSEQHTTGAEYATLSPVVSVWVCEEDAFPDSGKAHLRFRLLEVEDRFSLHDDIRFEVVQLSRVKSDGTGLDDADLVAGVGCYERHRSGGRCPNPCTILFWRKP